MAWQVFNDEGFLISRILSEIIRTGSLPFKLRTFCCKGLPLLDTHFVYCAERTEFRRQVKCVSIFWLFSGLSSWMPVFDPRLLHIFVVDRVALEQVSVRVFWYSSFRIIPPMLHTHLKLHVVLTRKRSG